ncbi:DUF3089 domain-containing protein [Persicimonas caeni]|uniref:DUF3089 domain-containing protein n=1 Tax=Persicimonas caeni TaxID=2292766 RepID=A0A4Y6PXS9_PERCE|nr:DUF3089 domain-containing protein [Persicimonas caeni]QDG53063.1 DUF3089 domain-containing protein [Persicimonas caeni]QED34285.1 DUF3089 domain-containing protein [Persicimonas caeni]
MRNLIGRALLLAVVCVLPACSPACFLKPTEAFDQDRLAKAPDYSDPESWAALPGRDDKADFTPPGATDRQADAPADVFFVHPTTWFDRDLWNDPLDSAKSREFLHEIVLPGQASAFNACCRVFAPYYRQATIGAYFEEPAQAKQAFSVAYADVERAFDAFIDKYNTNEQDKGRPFIVASHSQGSQHAMRLLEKIDADPELRERMIAAYVPGFALPMSRYGEVYEHLEPCTEPTQTGCIVAWDTYRYAAELNSDTLLHWQGDELRRVPVDAPRQCTNPITWRADEETSSPEAHRGAVQPLNEGDDPSLLTVLRSDKPVGLDVTGLSEPREGFLVAQCKDGVLRVPDLDELGYNEDEMAPGNYHLMDYELFYMDIRHNAVRRTEAWLANHAQQKTP